MSGGQTTSLGEAVLDLRRAGWGGGQRGLRYFTGEAYQMGRARAWRLETRGGTLVPWGGLSSSEWPGGVRGRFFSVHLRKQINRVLVLVGDGAVRQVGLGRWPEGEGRDNREVFKRRLSGELQRGSFECSDFGWSGQDILG